MSTVAGFDGWKGGWVGVVLDRGRFASSITTPTLAQALDRLGEVACVGIDIPIGIPESGTRAAERVAKRLLGRRSSTVFLTPPRPVLEAHSYAEARRISTEQFERGVSAQAYALRHRILEVDQLAAQDLRIHEVHPELAFRAMNGDVTIKSTKKSWAGQEARRRLLTGHGIDLPSDLGAAGIVPPEDVLDAAAVAWTATRIVEGRARCAPENGEPNAAPMRLQRIWY